TARVKGLGERYVLWHHAFGNVMLPLVTVVALSYANLLEGSVLTETVFAWPGIGAYLTNSLLNADMNAVLGSTIVVGIVFIGLAIVLLLMLTALLAPLIAHQSPIDQDLTGRLRPPGAAFWFGTDELGRDIYSRIVYGARITLGIVALIIVLVGPIGLFVGCAAGYVGGWLDTLLMRTTDIFLAFPRLILALAFVAAI